MRKLSHEEALRWADEHRAWRPARKTRPIWARPVTAAEVGREFQTADHVKQVAHAGAWLCVGADGQPWFQERARIDAKYDDDGEETREFGFDQAPHAYRVFKPKAATRNWAAQVKGDGIEGFFIRPGYDPDRPLYANAGGYVVMEDVPDPYRAPNRHVWLVQQELFESTYEPLPFAKEE